MTSVASPLIADVRLRFTARSAITRTSYERRVLPRRDLQSEFDHTRWLFRRLWDAWLQSVGLAGGVGGAVSLRAVVAEELTIAALANQNMFTMPKILRAPFGRIASAEVGWPVC